MAHRDSDLSIMRSTMVLSFSIQMEITSSVFSSICRRVFSRVEPEEGRRCIEVTKDAWERSSVW